MNHYICPVCGYDRLDHPAEMRDYSICPSCGTEFGYDDLATSYEELRRAWLATGPMWWGPERLRPSNWDAAKQLLNLMRVTTT